MATKYKTNKRKLSSLVKQQVPQYVLEDHPKFTEFLSSYYLFMESAELNLTDITAVDNILLETEGSIDSYLLALDSLVFKHITTDPTDSNSKSSRTITIKIRDVTPGFADSIGLCQQ